MGETIVVAISVGLPLWLAVRCWKLLLAHAAFLGSGRYQLLLGTSLITVSTAIWMYVLALMFFQDSHAWAKAMAIQSSPWKTGVSNFMLCVLAMLCSFLGRSDFAEVARVRKAIRASSGLLMLIWLVVLGSR